MFQRVPDGLPDAAQSAAIKSIPPVAVGGLSAAGVSLEDWVLIVTLFYLALQIAYLVYKFVRERRAEAE